MRLKTKSIITLVAMLLSGITEAWGAVTVIIQQNGTQVTVSSDGNGGMTSSAGTIKVLEPAQDGTVKLTGNHQSTRACSRRNGKTDRYSCHRVLHHS